MKKYFLSILCIGFSCFSTLYAQERGSSAPYISGDSFRVYCDFTFDELNKKIDFNRFKNGSTIFVKTDYLADFFKKVHPRIQSRYILVAHNSDHSSPGHFERYLDDDKLIAWFGQNIGIHHPKLHPIPIGIANRCFAHGNIDIVHKQQEMARQSRKDIFLYMNFDEKTYLLERHQVASLFAEKPYCTISSPKDYKFYMADLGRSKFVLSPRGNGLDCHRTWESLLMGAIPIVRESLLDPMYEDLPVLIVKDWNEITEEFLQNKYEEITSKSYKMEKAYIFYWLELINTYKSK